MLELESKMVQNSLHSVVHHSYCEVPFAWLNLPVNSFQSLDLISFSQTKSPMTKDLSPAFVLVDSDQGIP